MPERPDLEYVIPRLDAALRGACVASVVVKRPVVLRIAIPGTPDTILAGRIIEKVRRHGPFVEFVIAGEPPLRFAIHPMLAGRFSVDATPKVPADLALAITFVDGRALRYRDDKQMGKVFLAASDDSRAIPAWADVGVDVLDPRAFTVARLTTLARGRREQAKVFLLDHGALDHLGNAYADEALWAARIHPKARVNELSPAEISALHAAIVEVLSRACAEIAARAPAIDEKVRDFLAVRGKKDQPCPRCATKVRTCGIHGHDAFYCPTCQVDRKGRGFVDWGKVPK